MRKLKAVNVGVLFTVILCCWAINNAWAANNITRSQILEDIHHLAADDKAGREPDTPGHAKAANYLRQRYQELDLVPLQQHFSHPFTFTHNMVKKRGTNIVGEIRGTTSPDKFIVFTAHYDHLGQQGRRIFNGADDNASGVAVMLAVAEHFAASGAAHSLLFVATDAEESGLHGAIALLNEPTIRDKNLVININLDMLGNGGRKQILFMLAQGLRGNVDSTLTAIPTLSSLPIRLSINPRRLYRDAGKRNARSGWQQVSDHHAFSDAGIPYLFFASDVHAHYHQDSDTPEHISAQFVTAAAQAVIAVATFIDSRPNAVLLSARDS